MPADILIPHPIGTLVLMLSWMSLSSTLFKTLLLPERPSSPASRCNSLTSGRPGGGGRLSPAGSRVHPNGSRGSGRPPRGCRQQCSQARECPLAPHRAAPRGADFPNLPNGQHVASARKCPNAQGQICISPTPRDRRNLLKQTNWTNILNKQFKQTN